MSIIENEISEIKAPPYLIVNWERKLIEEGKARLIEITLETPLDKISEPPSCYACTLPTTKAFTSHSLVSGDQKLIIATQNLPGYRCSECSAWPEPTLPGRLTHMSRSFMRDISYKGGDRKYILKSYTKNLPSHLRNILIRNQEFAGINLDYFSKEGLYEFDLKAASIFEMNGYKYEAKIFRESAEREITD